MVNHAGLPRGIHADALRLRVVNETDESPYTHLERTTVVIEHGVAVELDVFICPEFGENQDIPVDFIIIVNGKTEVNLVDTWLFSVSGDGVHLNRRSGFSLVAASQRLTTIARLIHAGFAGF